MNAYQMESLVSRDPPARRRLAARLEELLVESHDQFPPGITYADWYDKRRNLIQTALGPVSRK